MPCRTSPVVMAIVRRSKPLKGVLRTPCILEPSFFSARHSSKSPSFVLRPLSPCAFASLGRFYVASRGDFVIIYYISLHYITSCHVLLYYTILLHCRMLCCDITLYYIVISHYSVNRASSAAVAQAGVGSYDNNDDTDNSIN